MNNYLTKTARNKLARHAANKAFDKANNYQVGQAGKIIDEIVDKNPKQFIEFHARYCTPKHDTIINETVKRLKLQEDLF